VLAVPLEVPVETVALVQIPYFQQLPLLAVV
jgi:hypothetical protein